MPKEIGAGDAEFLPREIPRQLGEWRREHQRRDAALGVVGLQPAPLDAMRDEVVGITSTPRVLRPHATSDLTGRRRTRALPTANTAVRHKPATADAAGTLREHPQMLASSVGTQGGPLLASDPGSILASAEGRRARYSRRRSLRADSAARSAPTIRMPSRIACRMASTGANVNDS